MDDQSSDKTAPSFGAADIGALAHLYRGEMYQSKIWRNRLDMTGNWAVVITGIALSLSFSNAEASPIPLMLVTWVVVVFLLFEARRYLYYDLFRVRVRVMEINFYGPLLRGEGMRVNNRWNELLAQDYKDLRFHITLAESIGRRIRRTYGWIFSALWSATSLRSSSTRRRSPRGTNSGRAPRSAPFPAPSCSPSVSRFTLCGSWLRC